MRPGVSLAGLAGAAETAHVAGHAVEPGSQAERPGPERHVIRYYAAGTAK